LSSRHVVGLAPSVELVRNVWRRARPDLEIEASAIGQRPDFTFDETSFVATCAVDVALFVAIDNRFLNFKRLELMQILGSRGYRFDRIIGQHAIIGEEATIGDNVMIGEGAVIGDGAVIGHGVCIGARAVIGPTAIVEPGVWIEPGAVIGAGATIGTQTSVASGVVVAGGIEVGALCLLGVPGLIRRPVEDRTYFHPAFQEPIRILD